MPLSFLDGPTPIGKLTPEIICQPEHGMGVPRQPNGFRNPPQIVVHDHDVGGLHRGIGPRRAHRHADVGAAQSRRVVDAAAGHGGTAAMDLRTLHDWSVRLMLRTAPGVDDVTTWGGQEKQYQVLVHPQKLIKYGLSFKSVMEALAANNRQVGGQYVNLGQEQYLVRGLGLVANTTDIGSIVVAAHEGVPIYVRDVAEVKEGAAVRFGAVTRRLRLCCS